MSDAGYGPQVPLRTAAEVGKVLATLLHLGFTPMAARTPPAGPDIDALLGTLTGE
jgi:hypothetical protein